MDRKKRIENLTKSLKLPFLVTHPADLFYLSGFTGSMGFLLLFPSGEAVFLCDGRYTTQAKEELEIPAQILEFRHQVTAKIAEKIKERAGKELLVDERVSLSFFRSLEKEGLLPVSLTSPVRTLRMKKDPQEMATIKKALEISERAFERILPFLKPGVREKDVAIELDYQMRTLGGEVAFPTIVAAGKRTALPHAHPSSERFNKESWVLIDWGACFAGYCADLTRTVYLGNRKDGEFQRIFRWVSDAQKIARDHLKEGALACQIDEVVRKFLSQGKIESYFTHGLGHGVGIEIHEEPALNSQSQTVLAENMVVTVEPGVYFPEWGGIRLESMVVIQKDGCITLDRLNTF
ncbi:MAG: M24 family metallopeptidase [Candidatus Caldatribacteriaceae bacterium]